MVQEFRIALRGHKAKTEGPQAPMVSSHDIPKAFPFNVILSASRTSKKGYLSANGLQREYHGQYLSFAEQPLVELNLGCRKSVHH